MSTRLLMLFVSFMILGSVGLGVARAEEAPSAECTCPALSCSPCEDQVDITFYSNKCGEKGQRVRSCQRPTCQAKAKPPKACEKSEPSNTAEHKADGAQKDTGEKKQTARAQVGVVVVAGGAAWIVRENGEKHEGKAGLKVFEMDILETGDSAKMKIAFNDGNFLNVVPNSRVQIEVSKNDPKNNFKKTLINLMYGKVRSMVNQKYEGTVQSSFEVRTPTAVAGVRGTDFITSYYKSARTTKVETLEGMVELHNAKKTQKINIPAGNYASFIVEGGAMFDDSDIKNFVDRGTFTAVEKMAETHVRNLASETDFQPMDERMLASSKRNAICSAPEAGFNQCSWTCINNPSGSTTCRTDLNEVQCLRRRCNANGIWAEETRVPASRGVDCDHRKTIVKPCNY